MDAPDYEKILRELVDRLLESCQWDDGCLYVYGHSASELDKPLTDALKALKKP